MGVPKQRKGQNGETNGEHTNGDDKNAFTKIDPNGPASFYRISYGQPHNKRRREMLKAHPELTKLYGNDAKSFFHIALLVTVQFTMAYLLRDSAWWKVLLGSYIVGGVAAHALWVFIHEATHDLVFKGRLPNIFAGIFANVPLVVPAAISFRYYHLLHHSNMNTLGDPDVPSPYEIRLIGNSRLGKAVWLFMFSLFQAARTLRFASIYMDNWIRLNMFTNIGTAVAVFYFWGPRAFVYMYMSNHFALGFHPMGGRWIQEHMATHPLQETYSYYGPLNKLAYNIGYHNEHHDLPKVSHSRLPAIRKIASEFYDHLHSYPSYVGLIYWFIMDNQFSPWSRVVRGSKYDKEMMARYGEKLPIQLLDRAPGYFHPRDYPTNGGVDNDSDDD